MENNTQHQEQYPQPQPQTYQPQQQPYQQPYQQAPFQHQAWQQQTPVQPPQPPRKERKTGKTLLKVGSYIVTAALTATLVFAVAGRETSKPNQGAAKSSTPQVTQSQVNTEKVQPKKEIKLPADATVLQKAAAKVIPSVVLIKTYDPNTQKDFFANFFNQDTRSSEPKKDVDVYSQKYLVSEGSGIIYTEDGYIITNAHVLADGSAWQVVTTKGTVYNAKLVGKDTITDLAVIKIDAKGLPAAEFGSSSALSIAEQVFAVGNPAGEELSSTVTVGYVSALNRVINAANGSSMGYIQTDTAINPGNSGGALANLKGQVIGINTSKLGGGVFEGLGFAIPIDTALPLVQDMIKNGKVSGRVTLGVIGYFVQSQYVDKDGNRITGFLIARVQNPELAEAGVRPDLIITKADDVTINSAQTLRNYLASKKDGDKINLTLLDPANGDTSKVTVTLHPSYSTDNGGSNVQKVKPAA